MATIPLKLVKGGKEGDLLAQGWIKQTTIGEPRLSEIVENYRQLGYEVHVIEHLDESAGGCNTCFTAGAEMGQVYGDVYIRKGKGGKHAADDELF
ncbi:MAG: hypothetical protein KJZ92_08190 [Rhodocyclaceae bacterium]|jgi:hypothetical protein|nr:hypothetical protein [Rhodocyclaceae bacterium]MCL4681240.1 hypothetical protein [Rhodocyclaceae bacterium]